MNRSALSLIQNEDFISAIVFAAFGIFFVVNSFSLPFGSLDDMGPAFFPRIAGCILIAIAAAIGFRSVVSNTSSGQEVFKIALLPLMYLVVAVFLFVITLPSLGLIGSSVLLVAVSGAACKDRRWKEIAIIAVVLPILVSLIFVYGLSLQTPLLPWR